MITEEVINKLKSDIITPCTICGGVGHRYDSEQQKTVTCECSKEFSKRLRYEEANIPAKYWNIGFESFQERQQPGFKQIEKFTKYLDNALKEGIGLYVIGSEGTGKTMLTLSILKQALDKGYSGYFGTLSNIMSKIKEGFNNPVAEQEILSILRNCDLLVLDKVHRFYESKKEYLCQQFGEILDQRDFKNKSILVTSDVDMDKISTLFDPSIYSYFSSRLLQITIIGENYNKKDTTQRLWSKLEGVVDE